MDQAKDRLRGTAVGAIAGDALGMPLEFHPIRPIYDLETERIAAPPPASWSPDNRMCKASTIALTL